MIFVAHMSRSFVITVKILEPIKWSHRSPQLCSLVSLERLTNIEHIIQSLSITSPFGVHSLIQT